MTATRGRPIDGSRGSSRIARGVLAVLAIAMLIGACGDDDDSSATTTAPEDAVCDDAQALTASVDDLKEVDLVAEGTDGASAAITAVKDDLSAFSESAGDEVQPQVQAVEDAIDELETAVENLDSDPAGTALQAVSDVASSAGTLIATLDDGACG
jgi:hypothetical protein